MDFFNDLFQWLLATDEKLLLIGNGTHTPFMDSAMWLASSKWFWIPLYIFLACMVFRKLGKRKGIIAMVAITLLILAIDQTTASLMRPLFARMRPSNLDNPLSEFVITVNNYRGGRYGFPSSHAANSFGLAIFLSLLFRNKYTTISLIVWSLLVSYSRVYLGVHYPGDILVGFAVGSFFALICYKATTWANNGIRIPWFGVTI